MKHSRQAGAAVVITVAMATTAHAQSSVTLYGIVDNSMTYQSSQTPLGSTKGGRIQRQDVIGRMGGQPLRPEGREKISAAAPRRSSSSSRVSILPTGAQQYTNAEFGRQAWVGVTNPTYGTFTAGRQYTSYYSLFSPYSPTNWLTGFYGAHPGDLDELDTIYRANNSLVYTSPKLYGFTFSGSYSFARRAGQREPRLDLERRGPVHQRSVRDRGGHHAHQQLDAGRRRIRRGFDRANWRAIGRVGGDEWLSDGAGATADSPLSRGYKFSSRWDVSACLFERAVHSGYSLALPRYGDLQHGRRRAALDARRRWTSATGYSYTRATKGERHHSVAQYQQFNLSEYYSLSKRTGLYALQAYPAREGQTLGTPGASSIINATATLGDGFQSAPSFVAEPVCGRGGYHSPLLIRGLLRSRRSYL